MLTLRTRSTYTTPVPGPARVPRAIMHVAVRDLRSGDLIKLMSGLLLVTSDAVELSALTGEHQVKTEIGTIIMDSDSRVKIIRKSDLSR